MTREICESRSHVGLVRPINEDAVYAGRRIWAVADGMGGHSAGEVASALAISALRDLDEAGEITSISLVQAISDANRAIWRHGEEHPKAAGLGTTITGVARMTTGDGDQWAVFNVGDSRVYQYLDGRLTKITIDHSEVEELVLAGVLTNEQARIHPMRNIVTRALGSADSVPVDVWLVPMEPGLTFLICSDGLTAEVPDDQIENLLDQSPSAAADALEAAALAAGGHDNLSLIVLVPGEPSVENLIFD